MVDIHSHVLPGIDDGSRSVEQSLEMLRASADQGIHTIAATSHFYPSECSPRRFLRRRAQSAERLFEALDQQKAKVPQILLGAEVYYFDGISTSDEVESLRIEGTPLLLLAMPFTPWTDRMVAEVERLNERRGICVLLAHVERYFRFRSDSVFRELLDCGVLMQSNAEFFLNRWTRRKAVKMLRREELHFIGSDCHNMTSRAPCIGAALDLLAPAERERLEFISSDYLSALTVS